jgi:hypothetical protein
MNKYGIIAQLSSHLRDRSPMGDFTVYMMAWGWESFSQLEDQGTLLYPKTWISSGTSTRLAGKHLIYNIHT